MGAHPSAPSRVMHGGGWRTLDALISEAPDALLSHSVVDRFGAKLPFLLKILAAAEPLSLQAHPSIAIAEQGFAEEEKRKVPRDAPHRNYKDRNHKPELLCALTPFDALYGFRPAADTLRLLKALNVAELDWAVRLLEKGDVRGVFELAMSALPERAATIGNVVSACGRYEGEFAATTQWIGRIAKIYPGDPGIIVVLLLNLLRLKPGEAIYLPAGNLHAYLDGVGVEIMAASDNVLRGGLTKKHVDLPQLLRVLDFTQLVPQALTPKREGGEDVYVTPAPEFRLSRVTLSLSQLSLQRRGPEILIVTDGEASVTTSSEAVKLRKGQSLFVEPGDPPLQLSGRGTLFRATING
jgi:mannose-6-phosphate isomerase